MIRAQPSGFWRRAAALGMDTLWLFCITGSLIWLIFGGALPRGAGPGPEAVVWGVRNLLPAVVFVVGWRLWGATPGKVLLELRVVDARTGERPSFGRALVRYVGYFVSALPLGLGFVWAAFGRRKQAWHDKLARTQVVRVEEAILPEPAAVAPRGKPAAQ